MGPITLAFKGPAAHSSKGVYVKCAFETFGSVNFRTICSQSYKKGAINLSKPNVQNSLDQKKT